MTNSSEAQTYAQEGRVLLKGLIAPEIAAGMTFQLQQLVSQIGDKALAAPRINEKPSYEIYGYKWGPLIMFLWALTPRMEQITGVRLLPTYSFFRTYQKDDICKIHSDRAACEHSISLTLGYADDIQWALSVEDSLVPVEDQLKVQQERDYGGKTYSSFPMQPGDAVLYKGIERRHGRLDQNPNRWSAHLFLHWVDRDGPYADQAFDRQDVSGQGDFVFSE